MRCALPGWLPATIFKWIVVLSLMATSACVKEALPAKPSPACPAMTSVTSVQILLPPGAPLGKNSYRIIDPGAVRRLIDFVNLRRDVSPSSADVPPIPRLRATFYDGYRLVGIFGSGQGVLYFQCSALSETVRGTRPASVAETGEFQLLITPPNQ